MKFSYLIVFGVLLSACLMPPVPQPKDDQGNQASPYPGAWEYSQIDMDNGNLQSGQQQFGTFSGSGKDIQGSFTIKEDGTFTTTLSYTASVQVSVFGQTVPQDIPVAERTISGTWSESNGKISFNADDGSKVNVSSSSATEIIFSGTFMEQVQVGQFSLQATADVEFTIQK